MKADKQVQMKADKQEYIFQRGDAIFRSAWAKLPVTDAHCAPFAFAHAANLDAAGLRHLISAALDADLLDVNGYGVASFERWADLTSRVANRSLTYGRIENSFVQLQDFVKRTPRGIWILAGSTWGTALFGEDHVLTVINGVPWGYIPRNFLVFEAREVLVEVAT